MKLNYTLLLALLLLISSFLFGCADKEQSAQDNKIEDNTEINSSEIEPLTIYTTIFPLEDFTKKIGRDHVKVVSIFPPGVDAHTFEPTAKTMVDMANADAFVYTGAGIEGFAETAIKALKNENVTIIKATEGIELVKLEEHANEDEATHDDHKDEPGHDDDEGKAGHEEHVNGDLDPHVWLDPTLAVQIADNILQALIEKRPEARELFEQNYNTLKTDLEKLDKEFENTVKQASKKEILVSHAAYGYWESRYGIEQISVTGLSPTNEPSQKELSEIIETAKKHNIKYVIFEQNVSTKIANIVKSEIKADSLTLNNLESITEEESKNNEDYFSIMRRNLDTLKKALN